MSTTGALAVLDASALAEYLLGTHRGEQVAEQLAQLEDLHAPHLIITETLSVIRGWTLGGHLEPGRGLTACHDLVEMPLHLWDARPLTPAVWGLRHNLSSYDATYVALAQALEACLVTADARLAKAAPDALDVRLIG